jgi:hypothetical protein
MSDTEIEQWNTGCVFMAYKQILKKPHDKEAILARWKAKLKQPTTPPKHEHLSDTPAHISGAITGFTSIGSGCLMDFRVNNKLVKRKLTYKENVRLERGLGLFADGKLITRIRKEDTWSIDTSVHHGMTLNQVDRRLSCGPRTIQAKRLRTCQQFKI